MLDLKALLTKILQQFSAISTQLTNLMPTRGSNTNGNWVKYPDGTMICWGAKTVSTNSSGGRFGYYGSASATFPQTFSSIPNVATNYYKSPVYWNSSAPSVTASGCTVALAGDTNATNTVTYIAVGRWK